MEDAYHPTTPEEDRRRRQLQQSVRNLYHVSPFNAAYDINAMAHFYEYGYMLAPSLDDCSLFSEDFVREISEKTLTYGKPLANEKLSKNTTATRRAERWSFAFSDFSEIVLSSFFRSSDREKIAQIDARLRNFSRNVFGARHLNFAPSILLSTKGSTKVQIPHLDLPPMKAKSFLALVALENSTRFLLYPESHKESDCDTLIVPKLCNLSAGQILIFHPRLLHGGWYHASGNTRLHFYATPPSHVLKSDNTYDALPETYARLPLARNNESGARVVAAVKNRKELGIARAERARAGRQSAKRVKEAEILAAPPFVPDSPPETPTSLVETDWLFFPTKPPVYNSRKL